MIKFSLPSQKEPIRLVGVCSQDSDLTPFVTNNWEGHLVVKPLSVEGQPEFKTILYIPNR